MGIGSSVVGPHSCQRAVQTIRSSTSVKGVQHNKETFLKECSSNQVSAGIFCQGTGKRILSLSLPKSQKQRHDLSCENIHTLNHVICTN